VLHPRGVSCLVRSDVKGIQGPKREGGKKQKEKEYCTWKTETHVSKVKKAGSIFRMTARQTVGGGKACKKKGGRMQEIEW